MNKAFEKILDKIKENAYMIVQKNNSQELGMTITGIEQAVMEVAEEYEDGWIPCNERLPEDDSICIVTVEYPNNETVVDYGWFDRIGVCWYVGMQEFRTSNIIAWQPIPEPYKDE